MLKNLLITASLAVSLVGCGGLVKSPVAGSLYTSVQSGHIATAQTNGRTGEACAMSILGLIAMGDASIEAARKNGGIQSIATVDRKASSILGLYGTYCTLVRGK